MGIIRLPTPGTLVSALEIFRLSVEQVTWGGCDRSISVPLSLRPQSSPGQRSRGATLGPLQSVLWPVPAQDLQVQGVR